MLDFPYVYVCACVRAGMCVPVCVCEKSIRMYQYLCECLGLILIFKVFRHSQHTHSHTHPYMNLLPHTLTLYTACKYVCAAPGIT